MRPFTPELKVYKGPEFASLTQSQKQLVSQLKRNADWIDEITPPIGQIIDYNSDYPAPDRNYQASVHNITVQPAPSFASINSVQLPPIPTNNIQPPDTVLIQGNNAGSAFAPRRTSAATVHHDNTSTTSSISHVTINGQPFNGPIYDKNGRQLN